MKEVEDWKGLFLVLFSDRLLVFVYATIKNQMQARISDSRRFQSIIKSACATSLRNDHKQIQ